MTIENNNVMDKIKEPSLRTKIHYIAGNHDHRICGLTKYKYPLGISECWNPNVGITFQPYKNPLGNSHLVTRYHFKHGYDFETATLLYEPFFNLLCRTNNELECAESRLYDILANVMDQLNKRGLEGDDTGVYEERYGRGLSDGIFGRFSKNLASLLSLYKSSTYTASALPGKSFLTSDPEKGLSNKRDTFSIKRDPSPEEGHRTVLACGHTHMPFHYIDNETHNDAINLGPRVKTCKPHHNTYLEIKDGVEALKKHQP